MIRVCHGEVFQCEESRLDRQGLISFFLNQKENAIIQVVDEKGKHIGLITYPEILRSADIYETIDKEYAFLNAEMFQNANKYYEKLCNPASHYYPVLNEEKEIEFFLYYEAGIKEVEILRLIEAARGAEKIADCLLEGGYKGIHIWGLNEIGFCLADMLRERGEIPFAVVGEFWDRLGFENNRELIRGGYNLYLEGNKAIPVSEMGRWRFGFPDCYYADFKLRMEKIFERDGFLKKKMLSKKEARKWLYTHLIHGDSFMAARLGITEENILKDYLRGGGEFSKEYLGWLYKTSGFFSHEGICLKDVENFAKKEKEAVLDTDLHLYLDKGAAGIINQLASCSSEVCIADAIMHDSVDEDDDASWIAGLKGKKVLVISPFAQTIEVQYQKRNELYSGNKRLPEFELITYKMIETQNGMKCGFDNFFEAYDYVIGEIRAIDFDVALIGAGAYGYLLAHDIKKMGKAAIEICSSLMPLFGIKTKRHATILETNAFWNEHWTFPLEQPVRHFEKIENGCYWG